MDKKINTDTKSLIKQLVTTNKVLPENGSKNIWLLFFLYCFEGILFKTGVMLTRFIHPQGGLMNFKSLLYFTITAVLAGCSTDPVSNNGTQPNRDTKFGQLKSSLVSREIIAESDTRISSTANNINKFAVKMYSELSAKDGNLFFSPYSITCALGMTDAGANGESEVQIRKALQTTLAGDDFHAGINGLDLNLKAHSDAMENIELNVVNSIWAQYDMLIYVNFLDLLSKNYDAGVNLLNFVEEPESSRIIINDWVSEQTHDRINDLLPEGSISCDTRLVLTNAIYFLADWLLKFDVSKTDNQPFTLGDGSKVTVPMMNLNEKPVMLLYSHLGNNRIVELPYKGNRLAMDLILPDSGTFDNFQKNLSVEVVDSLINALDSEAVVSVRIPRFKFTTPSISLKETLKKLGMIKPFDEDADFSAISDIDMRISDVIHKAFVKVDEEGTEAAAATAVIIDTEAYPPPPKPEFIANRPFIFFIRDTETGVILFMGRILDPTIEQ